MLPMLYKYFETLLPSVANQSDENEGLCLDEVCQFFGDW